MTVSVVFLLQRCKLQANLQYISIHCFDSCGKLRAMERPLIFLPLNLTFVTQCITVLGCTTSSWKGSHDSAVTPRLISNPITDLSTTYPHIETFAITHSNHCKVKSLKMTKFFLVARLRGLFKYIFNSLAFSITLGGGWNRWAPHIILLLHE